MNLWRNSRRKRPNMKDRSMTIRQLLLHCWSTCRRPWFARIIFQQPLNTRIRRMSLPSSKAKSKMQRQPMQDWRLSLSKDKTISRRSRHSKAVLRRRCSRSQRRSDRWKMKWRTNSLALMTSRSISTRKRSALQRFALSFHSINQACKSKWPIMLCVMILRKIRSCRAISITVWMISRRSSSKTSPQSTLSSSTSKRRVLNRTIRVLSRIAWLFAMIST